MPRALDFLEFTEPIHACHVSRDAETGKQIKKLVDHSSFVNSISVARRGPPLVVSGSDDGTAKVTTFSPYPS